MFDEWRISTLSQIYKNKRDIQNCTNYRVIKFMSHIHVKYLLNKD